MRTLFWLLVGGPIAVIVMALAVVNNQPVTIALDPFTPATPMLSVTVPLYGVFFAAVMIGVLFGGVATWTGQGRFRKAARQNRREATRWKSEAERLRDAGPAPAAPGLPKPSSTAALPAPRRAA